MCVCVFEKVVLINAYVFSLMYNSEYIYIYVFQNLGRRKEAILKFPNPIVAFTVFRVRMQGASVEV